ncbi:MAG: M48 family metallopeptidase [Oligoflexales bacterium]
MIANIIYIFTVLKVTQWAWEAYLQWLNGRYYSDVDKQDSVMQTLDISEAEFKKAFEYTKAKDRFGFWSSIFDVSLLLIALHLGFFTWWETFSVSVAPHSELQQGLVFLMGLTLLGQLMQWPWDYYHTFCIEESFGFNKQTLGSWVLDQLKMFVVSFLLSIPILASVLWVMASYPDSWWWMAAALLVGFMILTSWLVPVFISPLFNKFRPLEEGELQSGISKLCTDVGFEASEVSIMDASIRSSHGNAYFTGLFKSKKIVLFDTLVTSMSISEILSVLAHELGHFKCHHIKKRLGVSIVMIFAVFFGLWCLSQTPEFTESLGLSSTVFGVLFVSSLWWPLVQVFVTPLSSRSSRKHEFEADEFAMRYTKDLGSALKKLSKHNHSMPLCHPLYSKVYHSHPPILERLSAL